MLITDISIRRPVLATVMNLIILLCGIVAFFKLQVRESPDVTPPSVSIESFYFGASPKFVERNITSVIESSIKTVKNIKSISSKSSSNFSMINVTLEINADIDKAVNDLRSKISDVMENLPIGFHPPKISKFNRDSQASMYITATGSKYDPMVLVDIVKQRVVPEIEKLSSVSKCEVYTNSSYAIAVKLDQLKLYQHKIDPEEIKQAIQKQSKDYPSGTIKTSSRDFLVMLDGSLNSPEEFENVIIDPIRFVKLKDVASVALEPLDTNSVMRYNGSETLVIGLMKDAKANILDLSNEINKLVPFIQKSLPDGVELHIAFDFSRSVKASIRSVYSAAFEALILVLIIVYMFLGNIRATIIPLIAIPVSIIGTFGFMLAANFSINLYSLLAMIMAIGLVVDDAIVMLENIYHHIEEGLSPLEASFKASKQVGFAIIAMTLTLAAVFLPIGFIDGFVGKLLIEFAWTLAFCVIISGFVALTLSPMLASKFIEVDKDYHQPFVIRKFNEHLDNFSNLYSIYLKLALKNLKIVLCCSIGSILILILSFYFVKKEFSPIEDSGLIILTGDGAEGATIPMLVEGAKSAENVLKSFSEVEGSFFNISPNNIFSFISLKDWDQRFRSQQEIVSSLNHLLSQIPSITFFAINPSSSGGGGFEKPVSFKVLSYNDFEGLDKVTEKFVSRMKESKIFKNPNRELKKSTPTIDIKVDRDMAAKYGVSLDKIGNTLQFLIAGATATQFNVGNEKYEVSIRLDREDRSKISDLSKIYIKSASGEMIHLSNLATIEENVSIGSYNHFNTAKSINIGSMLNKGYTVQDALNEIKIIEDEQLDKSKFSIKYSGNINNMKESNNNMIFTFLLAILFIYLVLSAQFESFTDPLIILIAVPFSITGGVLFLFLAGNSLNLYSQIGIITLIGLITKNSIMIVEFANKLKESGKTKLESILEASLLRLRPILMTTSATVIGAMPLAFASGAGAASRTSIGLVIVGGMTIGTLFTLFVIPCVYFKFKRGG